jgi:hypothetical protein
MFLLEERILAKGTVVSQIVRCGSVPVCPKRRDVREDLPYPKARHCLPVVLRVEQGKGNRDREIPLSPTLLAAPREYYRWMRPRTYLFPGTHYGAGDRAASNDNSKWTECTTMMYEARAFPSAGVWHEQARSCSGSDPRDKDELRFANELESATNKLCNTVKN